MTGEAVAIAAGVAELLGACWVVLDLTAGAALGSAASRARQRGDHARALAWARRAGSALLPWSRLVAWTMGRPFDAWIVQELVQLGRLDEADRAARAAIARAGNKSARMLALYLAARCEERAEAAEALHWLDVAERVGVPRHLALVERMLLHGWMARWDDAEAALREIAALHGAAPGPDARLAYLRGDAARSLRSVRAAMSAPPASPALAIPRAIACVIALESREAELVSEWLLQVDSRDLAMTSPALLHAIEARVASLRGDAAGVRAASGRHASGPDVENPRIAMTAARLLVQAHLEVDAPAEALAASEALDAPSPLPVARHAAATWRGRALEASGRIEEARAAYSVALACGEGLAWSADVRERVARLS